MKSQKMHKFRESLNISLVKTSTVSFNCLKSCSQSTVSQENYQGSNFLPFQFNFAISTFGNLLRNVQLKWFHFKYLSHTTESVSMAIIFWQTEQNHFELFFLSWSFKHSAHAESWQYFPINIFHIRPHKRWKTCILSSTYFSSLVRSDIILTSDFNFPFVISTTFSMCFAMDVETTHSKRILSFFALFNLMNGTIKFFRLILLIFFWRWKTYNCQHCTFWSSFFLKERNLRICQHQLAKKNTFFKNKMVFLHYKCCIYQKISFFLSSGWNWLV